MKHFTDESSIKFFTKGVQTQSSRYDARGPGFEFQSGQIIFLLLIFSKFFKLKRTFNWILPLSQNIADFFHSGTKKKI